MDGIRETAWRESPNQMAEFKHFYAFKNGLCFMSVATRTGPLRFVSLPMMRGTTMEIPATPIEIESDEDSARHKVSEWLRNQS